MSKDYNPCADCGGEDCVCCSYYLEQQASARYQYDEPGDCEDDYYDEDMHDAFMQQEEERRERMIQEEEDNGLFFESEKERDAYYNMLEWERTHLC